jgi:hypothetical protein
LFGAAKAAPEQPKHFASVDDKRKRGASRE